MKFLSLFAGIGGFDLGLERAGMTCVGQVEIDPFCRAVLAKHWPGVKRMEDVREVRGDEFGPVDLVCGGVPCQPASCAGKRKGADDDRWLWPEFSRIVRAVRPAWFVAENVRGFLSLSAATGVIGDLEGAGYEIRTVLLGAHHVGAPHKRDRIWIVGRMADAEQHGWGAGSGEPRHEGRTRRGRCESAVGGAVADAASRGLRADGRAPWDAGHADECGAGVADAEGPRREGDEPAGDTPAGGRTGEHGGVRWPARPGEPQHEWEATRLVVTSGRGRKDRGISEGPGDERARASGVVGTGEGGVPDHDREPTKRPAITWGQRGVGVAESRLGVATDGLPRRLAGFARRSSLKALGNAVVPQVAEVIGRAIMEASS